MRAYLAQSTFKSNEAAMSWMVIIAIFGPAQGFLNALVFFNRIDGFKKLCQCCTFQKLCRCCTKDGDQKTDKKDNSPLVSGSAPDKEKDSAASHVTSVALGTKELGKAASTMESILEEAVCDDPSKVTHRTMESILEEAVCDDPSKVTHHELLPEKRGYPSKKGESGEESKAGEEIIQAAEAETDEFTPKIVDFNKEFKIVQAPENDSEENNWAAAEEFLALTEDDGMHQLA